MKYEVKKYRGKVVPNARQWQFLLHELEKEMATVVQKREDTSGHEGRYTDPLIHLAASVTFANEWLLKKQAREFIALLHTLARQIRDGRESAAELVATFDQEDIDGLPWGLRSDKKSLAGTAAGLGYHFHRPLDTVERFQYGWEKNKPLGAIVEHRERWAIEKRDTPGNFGKEEIWAYLENLPKLKKDHPQAAQRKVAWDPLNRLKEAAGSLQHEAGRIDRLFAQLWKSYIAIPLDEQALELALEALEGPLDSYTWVGAGGHTRRYRDSSAGIAWACQQSLDWTRETIDGLILRIEKDPEQIVEPLNTNFENWYTLFQGGLQTAKIALAKSQAKKDKVAQTQKELAATPIEVPAFVREDDETGMLVDPKALLKGLTKRRGFVDVLGIVVDIKTLRGWLQLANQKPIEDMTVDWTRWKGKAIPTGKTLTRINKANWLYATAQKTVKCLKGYPGLVLVPGSQDSSLKVKAALAHFEASAGQFVHTVRPEVIDPAGTTAHEEMTKRHGGIYIWLGIIKAPHSNILKGRV